MKNKINEYYELIEDEDLQSKESYESMILRCPKCGALFSEKACGMRTIFPWFGYHPKDGNCKVLKQKFASYLDLMASKCDLNCDAPLERITTVKELTKAIKEIEYNDKG